MPYDKKLHFACGAFISISGCLVVNAIFDYFTSVIIGTALSVIAGIAKEIYDYFHMDKHTPDAYDAFYTCVGGCLMSFILLVLERLI